MQGGSARGHAKVKVSQLVSKYEKAGGQFLVENRKVSLTARPGLTLSEQRNLRRFDRLVRQHSYGVTAWILERIASWKWERDFACHCPARRFAHPAHRPEEVWKELRKLMESR